MSVTHTTTKTKILLKLCFFTGTDETDNSLQVKYAKREATKGARGKPLKNTRAWLLEKKERRRKQGKETKPDTKYTGRKRSGRF